ncbi:MFS transporter [Actinosynnema sp. NPDC059335]|uniref:MFS transporter n=1 Tax=Actinosynnema sp. NPDC059335 TaxID=3346804 RepID=UPI00367172D9
MSVEVGDRAGTREWLGLIVLLLPTALLFVAQTVLFLATPHIAADLRPSSDQLLWVNDVYGFAMAGLLVAMGTIGDRVGRRKILLLGAVLFGIGSVIAAFAPNIGLLIAARAFMGVGAAAVMPSTLSLVPNMFRDPRQRATAVGMWAASVSVGVAVGPLLGGLLLEAFWWGAALLIGVPVMALVIILAPLLVPEYKAPNASGQRMPDMLSVLLSMLALVPFVYGVKDYAKSGLTVPAVVTTIVGIVFGVIFVRRQLSLDTPLLDMRLFRNRSFSGALGVWLLSAIALGGIYLLFTQYLQQVAGLSPLAAGLWILPAALMLVVVSTISPIVARKVRPAYVVAVGALFSLAGYIVLTQVESVAGLPMLITGFYLLYPGIAPTMALTTDLVMSATPPEKQGAASAVSSTSIDLGVSLGIAVMGSIGTAVYHATIPSGLPAQAADSLSGALNEAADMSGAAAESLIATARESFTSGLNVAGIVAAVLVAGAGLLALTLLRHVPPAKVPEAQPDDAAAVSAA